MGLLDAARVRAANKQQREMCTIGKLKQRFPDVAADIEKLVANSGPDEEVPYTVAAETLVEELKVEKFKGDVVSRHKRHVCSCPS